MKDTFGDIKSPVYLLIIKAALQALIVIVPAQISHFLIKNFEIGNHKFRLQ